VAIRADTLDTAVWEYIVDLLDNPDHLTAEIERMRVNDPTETDLAAIDRSLVKVSRSIDGLTKGFAAVQTDEAREILAHQLDAAAAHQRQLQDERSRVLERRQGWLDAQRRVDDLHAWLVELRGAVQDMPYALKRRALLALDLRVTVHPKTHDPRWEATASIPFVDSEHANRPVACGWRDISGQTAYPFTRNLSSTCCCSEISRSEKPVRPRSSKSFSRPIWARACVRSAEGIWSMTHFHRCRRRRLRFSDGVGSCVAESSFEGGRRHRRHHAISQNVTRAQISYSCCSAGV